jgi:hypothetical protein
MHLHVTWLVVCIAVAAVIAGTSVVGAQDRGDPWTPAAGREPDAAEASDRQPGAAPRGSDEPREPAMRDDDTQVPDAEREPDATPEPATRDVDEPAEADEPDTPTLPALPDHPPPTAAITPLAPEPIGPPLFFPRPPDDERLPFKLVAGLSMWLGVLPLPAAALQLEAESAPAFFSVRLRGTLLLPQTRSLAEGTVRYGGFDLALHACLEWMLDSLPLLHTRVCLGPSARGLQAAAHDFQRDNGASTELSVNIGTQLEAAVSLSDSTSLRVGLGGGIALSRPRFLLELANSTNRLGLPSPDLFNAEVGLSLVQVL